MKTLFAGKIFILLAVCLGIWGCSKDDGGGTEPGQSTISTDVAELNFDSGADELVLTVTASGAWTVDGTADWCTLSAESGEKGDTQVRVAAAENEGEEDRQCTLTFRCGNATARVEVYQFGRIETNYVDMRWDDDGRLVAYDEATGRVTVGFDTTPPDVEEGKAIILPEEQKHAIRVVRSAEVSGNTLTMQTEAGNMANLFRNIDFVLTTDPALAAETAITTRSGRRVRVVTPYRARKAGTRVGYEEYLVNKQYDWADDLNKLLDGVVPIHLTQCNFGFQLKFYLYMSFGEKEWNGMNIGDLQAMSCYLDGNVSSAFAFGVGVSGSIHRSDGGQLFDVDLPDVPFFVSAVPIYVGLNLGCYYQTDFKAEGEIALGWGYTYAASARLGAVWAKDVTPSPIWRFEPSFSILDPTLQVKASLENSFKLQPILGVEIYNFLGPEVGIFPELHNELKAGLQVGSSADNSYFGWTLRSDMNVDLGITLGVDLGIIDSHRYVVLPATQVYTKRLLEAPARLELVAPQADAVLQVGEETEVTFRVTSQSPFKNEINTPFVAVQFSTEDGEGGKTDVTSALTDADGLAKVKWTPGSSKDKLTAQILDADGQVIAVGDGEKSGEVVFEPLLEEVELQLLSPEDQSLVEAGVATPVTFRAVVKEADGTESPRENLRVRFTAPEVDEVGTTDAEGQVTFDWTPQEGETLTATAEVEQQAEDGTVSYVELSEATFAPHVVRPLVSLSTPADKTPVKEGQAVTVTFYVEYEDEAGRHPYPGREVTLSSAGFSEKQTSTPDGIVRLSWTPTGAEGDALTAELLTPAGDVSARATFTPTVNRRVLQVSSPQTGVELEPGESVTVTFAASWSADKEPISGANLRFSGNGSLSRTSATTDANGQASVTWTPDGAGTLTATWDEAGLSATFSATTTDEDDGPGGGGSASEQEKAVMGQWTCVYYEMNEGGGTQGGKPVTGSMTLTLGTDHSFRYVYADPHDPSESYTETGTWRLDGSTLMVKMTGYLTENGYCNIVSVEGDRMVTQVGSGAYFERFTWQRIGDAC